MHERSVLTEKNVCRYSGTRILTDSARKRSRKEVLANYDKTKINRPQTWQLDGIEGSVESSYSCWSAIAHIVRKLGHA